MFFKLGKGNAWFFSILVSFFVAQANAQQIEFNSTSFAAKPGNCVTLRQGRNCYTNITIQWQSDIEGDYCIQHKQNGKTLQCWKNRIRGQWSFEFSSNEKVIYQLIAVSNNVIIAETSVNVSWVHNATPRKRRWRLF